MKRNILISLLILGLVTSVFAQQPKQAPKGKPDPLVLTDGEQRELTGALDFIGQAKKEYDQTLEDALNAPLERLSALETLGRLQKSATLLKAANQHLADLKEKHKASRPGCEKCEYTPDLKGMSKPKE
jgi:deoxyribodipyrimidine photolyase